MPVAAKWLNDELKFPNWRHRNVDQLPTMTIGAWAQKVGFVLNKSSSREDRDAGMHALQADVPLLKAEKLDVLSRDQWERRKEEFVYASWVKRATAAAQQGR
jgi:hypothetical protein